MSFPSDFSFKFNNVLSNFAHGIKALAYTIQIVQNGEVLIPGLVDILIYKLVLYM